MFLSVEFSPGHVPCFLASLQVLQYFYSIPDILNFTVLDAGFCCLQVVLILLLFAVKLLLVNVIFSKLALFL
jgi:hypothetical protein